MDVVQEGPHLTDDDQPMEEDDVLLEVPLSTPAEPSGSDREQNSWL